MATILDFANRMSLVHHLRHAVKLFREENLMSTLPPNWTGQASRSLRNRVREMLDNALEFPGEWASLPPLRTKARYHPNMKHDYSGYVGVFEVHAGPYQAPFKTTFCPLSHRSNLEETLFRSCTGELRSMSPGREAENFVESLIVDDELDHMP